MKYYHKYKDALEAKGYRVDEHGYVWDSAGNQSAGEDNYGNVQSKDENVNYICFEADIAATKPKKPKKATPPPGKKRARTASGHFVKDDPNTPENEAWVDE